MAPDVHVLIPTSRSDLARARQRVETLAADIQGGRLSHAPNPARCAACDFVMVCKHAPQAALAAVDRKLAALL